MAWALSAPSSPAPAAHRCAASGLDRAPDPTPKGHPCRKSGAAGDAQHPPQMMQGNISVRQRALASGAFLGEAIRPATKIVVTQALALEQDRQPPPGGW